MFFKTSFSPTLLLGGMALACWVGIMPSHAMELAHITDNFGIHCRDYMPAWNRIANEPDPTKMQKDASYNTDRRFVVDSLVSYIRVRENGFMTFEPSKMTTYADELTTICEKNPNLNLSKITQLGTKKGKPVSIPESAAKNMLGMFAQTEVTPHAESPKVLERISKKLKRTGQPFVSQNPTEVTP